MTDRSTAVGVAIDAAPRRSAVSWGAVLAGALVAIALTLALLVLGGGLGLTLVSPWWEANSGIATIGISTVAWLVVMQWVSSGLGGYLTGRLRNRWTVNSDEVFFRDTAHGLLTWALATIIMAGIAANGISGLVSAGSQAVGAAAGGAASAASEVASTSATDPTAYFVDSLFRPATPQAAPAGQAATPSAPAPSMPSVGPTGDTAGSTADLRAETMRIVVRGMTAETFPDADKAYLAQRVATATGMTQEQAEARVNEVLQGLSDAKAKAQAAAEEARKAAVTLAIIAFISLLLGAFIGAVAAALGGAHRDDVPDNVLVG
jgi:hypothetical protein